MSEKNLIPRINDIQSALELISPYIHRTPVFTSEIINRTAGCSLYFKCENLQRAGAFKFRGAVNALLNLERSETQVPVITHSSGNHAGALAKASAMLGFKSIVVMPENAPRVKVDAVRSYGGEIVFCKPTLESRESTTQIYIEKTGAVMIHPYNNFYIIAGQGTASLELLTDFPDLDCVIAPVGGGGLLSGTSIAAKNLKPGIKVFGAEPLGADDAYRSIHSGKIVPSVNPKTIADGLLTSLCERTFTAISQFTDDILCVSEESIISAMKLTWQHLKLVAEPSGVVPLAAVMEHGGLFTGKKIGLIISGGNVDFADLPFARDYK